MDRTQDIEKKFEPIENFESRSNIEFIDSINERIEDAWTKLELYPSVQDTAYSSTISRLNKDPNIFQIIEDEMLNIVDNVFDDDFYDESYDTNIYRVISRYGENAILVICSLIDTQKIKFLKATHLLSLIGRIHHFPTYQLRTWLLEKSLHANSKYVRDGASLGILYLENPSTITSLKEAIERESSKQLKKNMNQVLNSLENLQ